MSKPQLPVPAGYAHLLKEIKARIQQAQTRAVLSVNAELILHCWDIGRMIAFCRCYPAPANFLPQAVAKPLKMTLGSFLVLPDS